jgi:hypothetical protein
VNFDDAFEVVDDLAQKSNEVISKAVSDAEISVQEINGAYSNPYLDIPDVDITIGEDLF